MVTTIPGAVSAHGSDTVMASAIEIPRKYDSEVAALHVGDPPRDYLGGVLGKGHARAW
jgi:hypothetical protein